MLTVSFIRNSKQFERAKYVGVFQVLYYGFNLGVEYRYAVPLHDSKMDKEDAKKHRLLFDASYGWVHGGWGKCNVYCGGGKVEKWMFLSFWFYHLQ